MIYGKDAPEIWRALGEDIKRVILPDISGHWAEAEIRKAYELGLMKGKDDGLFHPNDPLTRAEAAVLICRLYEEVKR